MPEKLLDNKEFVSYHVAGDITEVTITNNGIWVNTLGDVYEGIAIYKDKDHAVVGVRNGTTLLSCIHADKDSQGYLNLVKSDGDVAIMSGDDLAKLLKLLGK